MSENHNRTPVSRRTFLTTTGGASALVLAGCSGIGSTNGKTLLGYSNFTNAVAFEVMVRKATEWYASDLEEVELLSTAADGTTAQQIQDCRNMLRQGVEGLIITPTDSNGLAIIAEEADVPVFSCDIPVNSDQIKLHTGVNQRDYAYKAGSELVEVMRNTFDADTFNVLEIMMDQDNSNAVMRHNAFNEAMDDSDKARVIERVEIDGYSATAVAQKVTTWLQTDPTLHGVFAPWAGGPIGVLKAFERHNMKHKVGQKGHIPIVSCDATAAILTALEAGYIDKVIDQPVTFYGPLSIYFMRKLLENGQDALPDIGTTGVTSEDVDLSGGTHFGVEIWEHPLWAPATVRELVTFGGHKLDSPFFTTNAPIITEELADAPYIWGNLTQYV